MVKVTIRPWKRSLSMRIYSIALKILLRCVALEYNQVV